MFDTACVLTRLLTRHVSEANSAL